MKRQLAVFGFAVAACTSAFAGQVTQTLTVGSMPLDFSTPLTFNKFDPTLGTLTDIQFIVNVTANDSTVITNTSGRTRSFTFSSSVDLAILNMGGTTTYDETIPATTQSVSLNNNQTTTATGSSTGTATVVYSAPSGALSSYTGTPNNGNPSNPIVVANFVGTGQTVTLGFDASNNSSVSGGSNTSTSSGTASGSLEIIYDYTVPVTGSTPEPTTMLLFGSALVGIGTFKKFRKKSL